MQMKNATDDYATYVTLAFNTIYGRKWAFNLEPFKLMDHGNIYHDDPLPPLNHDYP